MKKIESIKSDFIKLLSSDILINIIILLLLNIVLLFGIISKNGIILQVDFNFPIFDGNFIDYSTSMWYEFNSQPNIEQIMRLFIRLPYIFLAYLGVDVGIILRLMVFVTYTFVSISTFLFITELFKTMEIKNRFIALAGSLMFAYNPVMLQFGLKISIPFSIGVLPLILFLILRYQETNSKKFIILFPILLLLSLGHPFTLIMNLLISFIFSIYIYSNKLLSTIKKYFLIVILFSIMFSWFIIPYMLIGLTSADLGRSSNLEEDVFEYAFDNQVYGILILERDNLVDVMTFPNDELNRTIHKIALIVLLSISIFIPFREIKSIRSTTTIKLIFFTIFAYIITVLLSLGPKSPIKEIYLYLITSTPIGWIIRSPIKYQLYESFFLIILFSIGMSLLIKKYKVHNYVYILIVIAIFMGMSGYGIIDFNKQLKPIQIPQQFFEINNILEEKNDDYKVMWYPRYNSITTNWSEGHKILAFDQKSSRKPTFATEWNYNFVKYNLDEILYKTNISEKKSYYDYLLALGIKYIAFHNDRNKKIDSIILNNIANYSTIIYNKGDWYLFELKGIPANIIDIRDDITINETETRGRNIYISELDKMHYGIDNNLSSEEEKIISTNLKYTKIKPFSWKIDVSTSRPFLLSLSEVYDPLWEAVIYENGQEISILRPVCLYSTITGFWIDKTDDFEIIIRYRLQYIYELCLLIAIVVIILCIANLLIPKIHTFKKQDLFTKNQIVVIFLIIIFIIFASLSQPHSPELPPHAAPVINMTDIHQLNTTVSPDLNVTETPQVNTTASPYLNVTETPQVNRTSSPDVNATTPLITPGHEPNTYSIKFSVPYGFIPDIITINQSDLIVWNNEESQQPRIVLISKDGLFENKIMQNADKYNYQFNNSGNYSFILAEYNTLNEYPEAIFKVTVK